MEVLGDGGSRLFHLSVWNSTLCLIPNPWDLWSWEKPQPNNVNVCVHTTFVCITCFAFAVQCACICAASLVRPLISSRLSIRPTVTHRTKKLAEIQSYLPDIGSCMSLFVFLIVRLLISDYLLELLAIHHPPLLD